MCLCDIFLRVVLSIAYLSQQALRYLPFDWVSVLVGVERVEWTLPMKSPHPLALNSCLNHYNQIEAGRREGERRKGNENMN